MLQDEIFHVPQVQAYCAGNFSHWDPMITTLPGLYSVSWIGITILERALSALGLLTQVGPDSVLCSTPYLRGQNVLFLAAVFVLLYKIAVVDGVLERPECARGASKKRKEPSAGGVSFLHVTEAFNLSTFPVLFFFCCLYYTDLGATCFVLLGYYQALNGRHFSSAVVSASNRHSIQCSHTCTAIVNHTLALAPTHLHPHTHH